MKLSLGITPRDYTVSGGAVAYDTDAQAYFTANTSITSDADKNAINTFYLGLKSDGIYTKIKAMYLPIWGSAASSKWNLINPLDTNEAFRLTFHGTSWAYSSGGITPTNAYANTYFNTATQSTLNNTHASYYSRTNSENLGIELGNSNGSGSQLSLALRYTSFGCISDQYNSTTGRIIIANANSQGLYITSRTTSAIHKLFKNSAQIGATNTGASGSLQNLNIYIGAQNSSNTAIAFSNRQCAFASIGDGLTDAQVTNFYTRLNTLMTYFGINV